MKRTERKNYDQKNRKYTQTMLVGSIGTTNLKDKLMSWSKFFIGHVNSAPGVMNIYFTSVEHLSPGCFLRLLFKDFITFKAKEHGMEQRQEPIKIGWISYIFHGESFLKNTNLELLTSLWYIQGAQ